MAALRQGGADVFKASLGQGLFSDPIDKTITSFVVFIILAGLSPRFLARFPLGRDAASGADGRPEPERRSLDSESTAARPPPGAGSSRTSSTDRPTGLYRRL